ncbi:hypothetical protein Gotur_003831, partial [Gossypium turneri]
MSGFPESNASFQSSRGTKRKWVSEEDAALVSCMVDLHNVGTFNADAGFKAGYLNELEKMLEKVLPNAMLKAKPDIESRIRLLKRDWSIVYDMLNGKNNSDFDRNQGGSTSSKKIKKNFNVSDHISFSFHNAVTLLAESIRVVGEQISRSIASDVVIQLKSEEFQI